MRSKEICKLRPHWLVGKGVLNENCRYICNTSWCEGNKNRSVEIQSPLSGRTLWLSMGESAAADGSMERGATALLGWRRSVASGWPLVPVGGSVRRPAAAASESSAFKFSSCKFRILHLRSDQAQQVAASSPGHFFGDLKKSKLALKIKGMVHA